MVRCIKFYMNCTTLREEPSTHDVTTVTMETRLSKTRGALCKSELKKAARGEKSCGTKTKKNKVKQRQECISVRNGSNVYFSIKELKSLE